MDRLNIIPAKLQHVSIVIVSVLTLASQSSWLLGLFCHVFCIFSCLYVQYLSLQKLPFNHQLMCTCHTFPFPSFLLSSIQGQSICSRPTQKNCYQRSLRSHHWVRDYSHSSSCVLWGLSVHQTSGGVLETAHWLMLILYFACSFLQMN